MAPQSRGRAPTARQLVAFDPTAKGTNIALSHSNHTAIANDGHGVVLGTTGKSSGKWYFEIADSLFDFTAEPSYRVPIEPIEMPSILASTLEDKTE